VAFGEDLIGVATLRRLHGIEAEVDDQELDSDQFAQLGLVPVIEAGMLEGREHLIGAPAAA
jgi:hypothetical protein